MGIRVTRVLYHLREIMIRLGVRLRFQPADVTYHFVDLQPQNRVRGRENGVWFQPLMSTAKGHNEQLATHYLDVEVVSEPKTICNAVKA